MDRLDEWRVFVDVATRSSFSAAARALGRSPQAVTRAISALETRLGTRLLHRTTRSVSLTSDGERVLERSRRALSEFDGLEHVIEAAAPLTGRLSVTAPVLFGQLHVAPLVRRFLKTHPTLDARLLLLDRPVSLAEEGIDVGVRIGALADSALRARLAGHVRSVVCASPKYLERAGTPRSPEALAEHACIAFTGTTPIADRWAFPGANRRERSVGVRARLVVNSGQAAIDCALAGLGIVRVLSYQVERLVREKRLRLVLQSFEPEAMPVHLVQLPGMRSRAAVAFVEFAEPELRAQLHAR